MSLVKLFRQEKFEDNNVTLAVLENGGIVFAALEAAEALKFNNPRREVALTICNEHSHKTVLLKHNENDKVFCSFEFVVDLALRAERVQARKFLTWANCIDFKGLSSNSDESIKRDKVVNTKLVKGRKTTLNIYTTTQIARKYGLSAQKLNEILANEGLQYRHEGKWVIFPKFQSDLNLVETLIYRVEYLSGRVSYHEHTYWTEEGSRFIHALLRGKGYHTVSNNYVQGTLF